MPLPPDPNPADQLMKLESSRRLLLRRRLALLTGLTAVVGPSALMGCGGGGGNSATSSMPANTPPPTPSLGAHNLTYYPVGNASDPISTAPISTQTSGSTILACVGRGTFADFSSSLPTDNKGNSPYIQQDAAHIYTRWTTSGTALYAFPSAAGGNGHVVQTANPSKNEITLAVVEVINRGVIQDVKWSEVLSLPHTSQSVTTTGPATLVAFWWGDDDGGSGNVTATPDQGFTVIDSQLVSQQAVECVVATKDVSAAGSYNVTWTDTPAQGAQLWLVAVQ